MLAINGDQLTLMMDEDHGLGYRLMRELNELITGNLTAFASGEFPGRTPSKRTGETQGFPRNLLPSFRAAVLLEAA